MRRRAPLHYWAKANNAHYIAHILSCGQSTENLKAVATELGYGGTPTIATQEAFKREASIALELIVKAVIAFKIKLKISPQHVTRVRPTHDLEKLWVDAQLPKLNEEGLLVLLRAKSILIWSGRYAAPKTDDDFEKEQATESAIRHPANRSEIFSIDWQNFNNVYQVAANEFWKLDNLSHDTGDH